MEGTETVAKQPRRRRLYLYEMAVPFMLAAGCLFPEIQKLGLHTWLPCVLCVEVPLILSALRARNRWFHPERLPARWPADFPWQGRLDLLSSVLYLGVLAYFVATFLIGRHHEALRIAVGTFGMTAYLS